MMPAFVTDSTNPFLSALRERVLVFDGAFGTWMQGQDLRPDDFGGEALEGCNEHLVLTRPDLVAQMHDEFFAVGVDAVETATFGAFPLVLNEYGIADKTLRDQPARGRDRARGRVAATRRPTGPASSIGSIGPGTKLPSLGHIPYADAARRLPGCRSTGCSRAASTCCSSRRSTTCSRPRPRSTAPAAAMATAGVQPSRSWCR